jgi:hypothetical protein
MSVEWEHGRLREGTLNAQQLSPAYSSAHPGTLSSWRSSVQYAARSAGMWLFREDLPFLV